MRTKSEPLTEYTYFHNESDKLQNIKCPKCKDVGGMFRAFSGLGCRNCLNYFGEEDFK